MFNSPKPNTSSSIGTTSMCDDPNQTCIKYQSKHNTSSKSPTNILNGSKSSMYHGVTLDTNMTMVTFALVIWNKAGGILIWTVSHQLVCNSRIVWLLYFGYMRCVFPVEWDVQHLTWTWILIRVRIPKLELIG